MRNILSFSITETCFRLLKIFSNGIYCRTVYSIGNSDVRIDYKVDTLVPSGRYSLLLT